ncbi:MAG TPA: type IX secretion system sortase PorU [Flavitalea sp.]|nr:type IX secretion system sortase PorU [Flavitalea sp.]
MVVWINRSVYWIFLLLITLKAQPQNTYSPHSVLASGNWYKIAIDKPGIYKIDAAFLRSLGISASNLPTNSLRLFGSTVSMLPEKSGFSPIDDLTEISLQVEDGSDGILNENDYFLFFAPGPDTWSYDSLQKSFRHIKNLYSDKSYFFISLDRDGKRIPQVRFSGSPTIDITQFDDRYFHELDSINFLSSGKQWNGEEFSSGRSLTHIFPLPFTAHTGEAAKLNATVVARTFSNPGSFQFTVSETPVLQISVPPVATGPYDQFVREENSTISFVSPFDFSAISIKYAPGSAGSQGWLNWFEFFLRRTLEVKANSQLLFRDVMSVAPGNVGRFSVITPNSFLQIWDVSNPLAAIRMEGNFVNNTFQFVNDCSRLHEYVAFVPSGTFQPIALGKVINQDLHNTSHADMIIITHNEILPQAQRLAAFHAQQISSVVVTTEQVFNEFSSGSPDPTALRDFVKMYYDKAAGDTTLQPKYLLLFGDGSFDYKSRLQNNTSLVPAYQSTVSYDPLSTYTSDDFFGFLDDGDDINSNSIPLLDIGIGRLPATNLSQAKTMVDKIIAYNSSAALGPWRNEFTFIADDEDANLHFQDAEVISRSVGSVAPDFNIEKTYLDAFTQQGSAAGSRYPEVNEEIINRLFQGTLIWNYNGHGGYRRLAEEVILDADVISRLHNGPRLPLFITATCDFAPFDNPLTGSIGEQLLYKENAGAIALMTTTRIVFAFSNRVMNLNYLQAALTKKSDSTYPSLGEAVRSAKNFTYRNFGDVINNRKFTLLGDPALTLAFPRYRIHTTLLNGIPVSASDTLRAMTENKISGEVRDASGNILSNFNGHIYASIFDKLQVEKTRGNDPASIPQEFSVRKNLLFRGKATVSNGHFQISFVVPKDINYQFGKGKITYYAEDGKSDGNASYEGFTVGGTGAVPNDQDGPAIKIFLNSEDFISGSITGSSPVLIVKLSDSSGINTTGTSPGHDLVAILDNDPEKKYILNRYYESEIDNYKKGMVKYQLPELREGLHSLYIKAWDAVNNSTEAVIDFRVAKEASLILEHVLNYPNPFTTHTSFWFDHNRAGEFLSINIQVFTVTGKLVKTLRNTIFSTGNRSNEVEWDGRDDYGNKLGRGVYIYQLRVHSSDGQSADKLEKLYIL